MEIVVTGRRCSVSDSLREQVSTRIATIGRLKDRIIRVEVEFTAADMKGSPDDSIECQITLRSRGPVIRAEASAEDKALAFDKAFERLRAQLRKAADRRKTHRGLRVSLADLPVSHPETEPEPRSDESVQKIAGLVVEGDGPLVVREKEHTSTPLTLAQALDEMELVGHDFFLFVEAGSGRPSVVYRRKAYNYGVIHLNVVDE